MIKKISEIPLSVGAAAVYPYSDDLLEQGMRVSTYGDPYNMFRVVGPVGQQRIWAPRNLARPYGEDMRVDGIEIQFNSTFKPRNTEQSRVIDETVELLLKGKSFILEAPTGFGKSQVAGTLVIKGNGELIAVENVQNGDVLMGPDSKLRNVTGTHKSWSPIYRITPIKGEPFECNDVHILSLKSTYYFQKNGSGGGGKMRGGEVVNISVLDYLKTSKTFKHLHKLWRAPGIDLPERKVFDPYIVGLYLADGNQAGTPTLCCGLVKVPALDYVESVLKIGKKRFDRGAWYYSVPALKSVQEMSTKNGERHIHDRYLRNSRENRLQLLAGLLDGDGHLVKEAVFEIACKDGAFKDQILWLCRSLGFAAYAANCTKGIKSTGFTGQYWVITISGNTDQIPTKVPKKQAKSRQQKKDHLVTGFTVEYVRDDWVYGFALDGDHLYLLNDFTVTHNTICAMQIIARVQKKTLVVVTKEDIRDQWITSIENILGFTIGTGIGLIQGDVCSSPGAKIVIAMVQSLAKEHRYPDRMFKDFGLAIWDETHRVGADYFSQSCFRVPAKLRLGISATADRKDGRMETIEAHIGPILVRTEAIPMKFRVISIASSWQIPMVKRLDERTGQYRVVQLPHSPGKCGHITKLLARHHGRNQMIVQFVLSAYKKGRRVLLQSDLLAHLETLTSMIATAGVPLGDIGQYSRGLSTGAREVVKTKKVIMATFSMTAEATDIPWLDTLVMATPKSDVRQIVGRILRAYPEKKDPVVFDIVDGTSSVFTGYYNKRKAWYATMGVKVEAAPKNVG